MHAIWIPFDTVMHRCWLLHILAFPIIMQSFERDPLGTTDLFFDDNGANGDGSLSEIAPFDDLTSSSAIDSSYSLADDPASSLVNFNVDQNDDNLFSSADLFTTTTTPDSDSCLFPPSRSKRTRRGDVNSCPNLVEGGPAIVIPDPGAAAAAAAGTVTQRKTTEEVKRYWCAETSIPGFENIPVCDAIFDADELFQSPVHKSLDGSVPDLGFFNIMRAWPRKFFLRRACRFYLIFCPPKCVGLWLCEAADRRFFIQAVTPFT